MTLLNDCAAFCLFIVNWFSVESTGCADVTRKHRLTQLFLTTAGSLPTMLFAEACFERTRLLFPVVTFAPGWWK